ncbi:hypothetical protein OKW34_004065 [Paraburkholderia youngii]|uniref:hypothetical protein n=1 Tax=Paraburkholderia youngii TaxID=2782701 RepID=UPI003D22C9F9
MMKIGVECRSGSSRGWREATLATPFNALRKSGGARTEADEKPDSVRIIVSVVDTR